MSVCLSRMRVHERVGDIGKTVAILSARQEPTAYSGRYFPETRIVTRVIESVTQRGNGGRAGTRTLDLQIKSPLLYQLSYAPEAALAADRREV